MGSSDANGGGQPSALCLLRQIDELNAALDEARRAGLQERSELKESLRQSQHELAQERRARELAALKVAACEGEEVRRRAECASLETRLCTANEHVEHMRNGAVVLTDVLQVKDAAVREQGERHAAELAGLRARHEEEVDRLRKELAEMGTSLEQARRDAAAACQPAEEGYEVDALKAALADQRRVGYKEHDELYEALRVSQLELVQLRSMKETLELRVAACKSDEATRAHEMAQLEARLSTANEQVASVRDGAVVMASALRATEATAREQSWHLETELSSLRARHNGQLDGLRQELAAMSKALDAARRDGATARHAAESCEREGALLRNQVAIAEEQTSRAHRHLAAASAAPPLPPPMPPPPPMHPMPPQPPQPPMVVAMTTVEEERGCCAIMLDVPSLFCEGLVYLCCCAAPTDRTTVRPAQVAVDSEAAGGGGSAPLGGALPSAPPPMQPAWVAPEAMPTGDRVASGDRVAIATAIAAREATARRSVYGVGAPPVNQ